MKKINLTKAFVFNVDFGAKQAFFFAFFGAKI